MTEKTHNKNKKAAPGRVASATKENRLEPAEEYVEMKCDEMETKLDEANDSAYMDLETAQNYETPVSLKDNSLADNVDLTYL